MNSKNHEKKLVKIFCERFDYTFKDSDLFRLALTHSKSSKENYLNNERLEFLGDRVLGFVIAEELYNKFKHENEGQLSKRFSSLVNKSSLSKIAKKLNLNELILTKKVPYEEITDSMISDCLEAIIAAIFLDSNFKNIKKIILNLWKNEIEFQKEPPNNPKSFIQEWCSKKKISPPEYKILKKDGPDHKPIFKVELNIKNFINISASGNSKREAEIEVAKLAISKLKI